MLLNLTIKRLTISKDAASDLEIGSCVFLLTERMGIGKLPVSIPADFHLAK